MRFARFPLAVALALGLSAGACNRAPQGDTPGQAPQQGPPYAVRVTNNMNAVMNVAYTIGDAVTALGQLQPGQSAIYSIPNRGSDDIQLVANQPGSTKAIRKSLDLKTRGTIDVTLQ